MSSKLRLGWAVFFILFRRINTNFNNIIINCKSTRSRPYANGVFNFLIRNIIIIFECSLFLQRNISRAIFIQKKQWYLRCEDKQCTPRLSQDYLRGRKHAFFMVYVFRTFECRLRFYYKVAIIYTTDGRIISFVIMVTLGTFQFGWGGGGQDAGTKNIPGI